MEQLETCVEEVDLGISKSRDQSRRCKDMLGAITFVHSMGQTQKRKNQATTRYHKRAVFERLTLGGGYPEKLAKLLSSGEVAKYYPTTNTDVFDMAEVTLWKAGHGTARRLTAIKNQCTNDKAVESHLKDLRMALDGVFSQKLRESLSDQLWSASQTWNSDYFDKRKGQRAFDGQASTLSAFTAVATS